LAALVAAGVFLIAANASAQDVAETDTPDEDASPWGISPLGEVQLRFHALSDIPLRPLPGDTDGSTGNLGQNLYLSSWARLGGQLTYAEHFRVVAQVDVLNGVIAGDLTQGVGDAQLPRDEHDFYRNAQLRRLFLDVTTPYMRLAVGHKGSHWGLGMLANDGDRERPFGDHLQGDIVERISLATMPMGAGSPWVVAGGADFVYEDSFASIFDGDRAVQGFLATWYEHEDVWLGLYGVHRQQWNDLNDHTSLFAIDGHGRIGQDMLGGRGFAAVEAAAIVGTTEAAQTQSHAQHDVLQALGVLQVGYEHDPVTTTLEAGYTSGDSNAVDGAIRRASFDESFNVGLVLFPEVMAWNSARAAAWARDEGLVGRPARGSDQLPTNGAVTGSAYLFPHASVMALLWLELRVGAIFAWSTAAVTDPYRQRAYSENVSWLGGDPTQRYLGTETDGAILARYTLVPGELELTGGVEGGVFFPGPAFEDAAGNAPGPMGLVRTKLGLVF